MKNVEHNILRGKTLVMANGIRQNSSRELFSDISHIFNLFIFLSLRYKFEVSLLAGDMSTARQKKRKKNVLHRQERSGQ